jgi:hypothetical protein
LADTQDRWREALVMQQGLETQAREEGLRLLESFEERAKEMKERVETETSEVFRRRAEIVDQGREAQISEVRFIHSFSLNGSIIVFNM